MSRHRFASAIVAWALGKPVQYRTRFSDGTWTGWMALSKDTAKFDDSLNVEYRVEGRPERRNQSVREAWLRGETVMFRGPSQRGRWLVVDEWIEGHCRKYGEPIWDRDFLEFQVIPYQG